MNRTNLSVILILGIFLSKGCSKAPGVDSISFEINQKLNPGINIGNALEAPNEGDWGVIIEDEFFPLIKSAGFNSVRLPISWSTNSDVNPPYAISTDFMNRVRHVVDTALDNDLLVVVNVQHFQEIYTEPVKNKPRLLAFWRQIGLVFKDYPPELLFEPLNEPHFNLTPELWNEWIPELIDSIRGTNPNRTLVIGTADWGGIWKMKQLTLPAEERNLILAIHYYEPFRFTHQGAEWEKESNDWLGRTWTKTADQMKELNKHFKMIRKFADSLGVPVYIGEYGCYHRAPEESRLIWTKTVSEQCEKFGYSRAYWEFCSGFGIYDTSAKQWREPLRTAVVGSK
ncbi:MAG: glycoside hydrolase family 5 protein [Candidatus Marinimicrobia bacterium]|nr:glycoside hydrolase family 5 protein [Candidatus Neomarinimicrobiota bacterium]